MQSASVSRTWAAIVCFGLVGGAVVQKSYGGSLQGSPFTPPGVGVCGGTSASPSCDSPLLQQKTTYSDMLFNLGEHGRNARKFDKDYALKESQKVITALALPCDLIDAEHAGGGKIPLNGRKVEVEIYEAACRSGTGYFLVSQPPEKSLAISCFAAEAAHAADIAKGAKPDDFACTLPGHGEVKEMAASVLKAAGTACDVNNYRWVGIGTANGTEYSEVGCADGQGYVLEVPGTGLTASVAVVGCQDALKEGIKCALTAVTLPVTLQTFRDALKEHAVNCEPAQIRYIGRETQGRRYVVELQCPQQPNGLVAFIPLADNPKPFETVDCAAAATRAVKCKLTEK